MKLSIVLHGIHHPTPTRNPVNLTLNSAFNLIVSRIVYPYR